MSQLAQVHATPGLAAYMAEVEAGLAQAVAAEPGLAQEVAGEALAAGGKRLRPLLCFLTPAGGAGGGGRWGGGPRWLAPRWPRARPPPRRPPPASGAGCRPRGRCTAR